jgi:hypothetical protein
MKSNFIKSVFTFLFILKSFLNSQVPAIQNFPVDLGYGPEVNFPFFLLSQDPHHYDKIKLKDISFECEDYYLYPVFIEDFNYLSDVEQNFQFWSGYSHNDADLGKLNNCGGNKPLTYFGDNTFAKNNGNVKCINGKLILERKLQNVVINKSDYSSLHFCIDTTDLPYTYKFTQSALYGLFYVRKGIVEADIKFSNFPYLWQAFWLFGSKSNKQEIDIVEYIPNSQLSNGGFCAAGVPPYSFYNFTIHNENIYPNYTKHHKRAAKFVTPGSGNLLFEGTFLDNYHKYTLYWDSYKVDLYLDNVHRIRGRKYIDGFKVQNNCQDILISPSHNWSCGEAYSLSFNSPNRNIFVDRAFPIDERVMNVIIGEVLHPSAFNSSQLVHDFMNTSYSNKIIAVDRLVIYQPVYCNANLTVPNLNTYFTHSRNSSFLGANKIEFAPNCNVHVYSPSAPNWNQMSLHVLANEHIIISDEFIFEEGNHLRLEILDCSLAGFNYNSKISQNYPDDIENNNDLYIDEKDLESGLNSEADGQNSISSKIYPNPAHDFIYFDKETIQIVRVEDVTGKIIFLETEDGQINIGNLSRGVYFVLYKNKINEEIHVWKFLKN